MTDTATGPTPAWGAVPVPDPTELTSKAVDRAKEDIRRELTAGMNLLTDQLAALDRLISIRFDERDVRFVQAATESRISLAAALAAAKEAVGEQQKANAESIAKSEVATQKQIDALTILMSTSIKALEDKVADIKERLDRGDPTVLGELSNLRDYKMSTSGGQQWGQRATAIVLAAVATFGAALAVVISLVRHP